MKFDLVKIFAAFFCFAVVAKSENAFQSRREGSLAFERDLMRMGRNRRALISVTVQLSFSDLTNEDVIPALNITAASGSTAFDFLQLASQQNPCYLSEYITYPTLGRYITTICCVTQNKTSDFYWFIYINNTPATVGVDSLIPNNGDVLRFEYRFYNSTDDNHTETSQAGVQTNNATGVEGNHGENETISVSVKLTFTNYPDPNVLPAEQVVAANGTTAFEFLQLAAQVNPCYIFNYTTFSIGRYITTICCVEQNKTTNFYWFIYINGKLSPVGADSLKPKNGDILTYEYRDSTITNHTNPTAKGHKMIAPSLHVLIGMVIGILNITWKYLEIA